MKILWVLALTAIAFTKATAAPPSQAAEAFLEGNRLYQEGRFEEASRAYERVQSLGQSAPEVEYNVGNSYLKSDRLGLAILHYRRALRARPGYESASSNLAYARSLTQDVKPEPEVASSLAWVGRLRLGPSAAAGLVFGAAAAAFGVAGLRLRLWRDRPWATVLQGAFAGLALLALAAFVFEWGQAHGRTEGVILVKEVEVHSGPGDGYTVSFRLHEGTEVDVLRERSGWREVRVSEKLQGWVPPDAIEEI